MNAGSSAVVSGDPGAVRLGVRIETVTLAWMVAEASIAIGAGVIAGSVLLSAFGIDSLIELISASTLLWRLRTEARGASMETVERAEGRAAWVTFVALGGLCAFVIGASTLGLTLSLHPGSSIVGIALAVIAVVGMPILAWRKRLIADVLHSSALRADAACSLTCGYMAATLLLGLVLNAVFHWWWADSVAALALLIWLVPETDEAMRGARASRAACACGEA